MLLAVALHRMIYKPKKYKLFPIWATIEIAVAGYVLSRGGLGRDIYSIVRRYRGSLFGITSTHQVLANFPGVDRLMSQSHHTINAEPVQYTLFTRAFGGVDTPELKKKLEDSWKDPPAPIERPFPNDAAATAAIERGGPAQMAASLISYSEEKDQMKRWELSADIKVVSPDLAQWGKPGKVEANLQNLLRDFGACFAIPLLYGKNFLDRNPHLLDDFWKFDNELFPLLMIGFPIWVPFKMMREGLSSRLRLLGAIEALYRRIDKSQRCEHVDTDISDVSDVPFERNTVYEREDWSYQQRAAGDLAIPWGQNANTQPVLFWLLAYVYSTPDLLESLRKEIELYITLSETNQDITSMDFVNLSRNSQLLKSCIFETYRMANEATSIRYVERPVTIDDGKYKHNLKPGMFLSAPHGLIQRDPSIYPDPDRFVPDRFLEADASGKLVARYGRLKPWGSGASMCKGRSFAEKEIMALSAAVIALWDIAPASGNWILPAMVPGTGLKKPVTDIRAVITRKAL
ncbi:putative cytochrome P450 [Bisporella sp. PMI_857]|nr:putative cytochrome P450 [Bisporella sp. PMI_857]